MKFWNPFRKRAPARRKYSKKRVYFIDGPLKNSELELWPSKFISLPILKSDGRILTLNYRYDALYPDGLVAYVRMDNPEVLG